MSMFSSDFVEKVVMALAASAIPVGVTVTTWLSSLSKKLDKVRDDFDGQLKLSVEDRAQMRKDIQEHKVEDDRLFEKLQDEHRGFVKHEDFRNFVEGEESKWHEIQRSLGRMEGKHPSSNPASK